MTKYTLVVDGMMCGMCESHVNDAVRKAFPVKKVTSEVLPKSWTKVMRQSHFEFCIGQDLTHSIFL